MGKPTDKASAQKEQLTALGLSADEIARYGDARFIVADIRAKVMNPVLARAYRGSEETLGRQEAGAKGTIGELESKFPQLKAVFDQIEEEYPY